MVKLACKTQSSLPWKWSYQNIISSLGPQLGSLKNQAEPYLLFWLSLSYREDYYLAVNESTNSDRDVASWLGLDGPACALYIHSCFDSDGP